MHFHKEPEALRSQQMVSLGPVKQRGQNNKAVVYFMTAVLCATGGKGSLQYYILDLSGNI